MEVKNMKLLNINNNKECCNLVDRRKIKKLKRKFFLIELDDVMLLRYYVIACENSDINVELLYLFNNEIIFDTFLCENIFIVRPKKSFLLKDINKNYNNSIKNIKSLDIDIYINPYVDYIDKYNSIPTKMFITFKSKSEGAKWKLKF